MAVQRAQLRELTLEQRAEAGEIAAELPLRLRGLGAHVLLRDARFLEQAPRLGLRRARGAHDRARGGGRASPRAAAGPRPAPRSWPAPGPGTPAAARPAPPGAPPTAPSR